MTHLFSPLVFRFILVFNKLCVAILFVIVLFDIMISRIQELLIASEEEWNQHQVRTS